MNYYIQGDAANADKIKAAFEKLGYDTSFVQKLSASDSHILFTLPCDTRVHAFHTAYIETDILKRLVGIDPDYKELELPVEPKFKVGDKALDDMMIVTVKDVVYDQKYKEYMYNVGSYWVFESALKPYKSHYDIANFKPKQWVLVRDDDGWEWALTRFSYLSNGSASLFICINGASFQQCIPFEGNEHLLGTTDMPSEKFINW